MNFLQTKIEKRESLLNKRNQKEEKKEMLF